MLDKLKIVEARYQEVEARLADNATYADPALAARLNQEQKELAPLMEVYRAFLQMQKTLEESQALFSDPDLGELAREEFAAAKAALPELENQLKILLLPKDPNDDKNVIVEIRAGVGGEEAALFAADLYRMYSMYAEGRHWSVEVDSVSETELGGMKEICFTIQGAGAYSRLKFESGVHRVQRVPETESGGRIHTSTVTVAVLPEMEEVDVKVDPADIEMQVFRSSGAGPRAWWWSASRREASFKTGRRPCVFWPPASTTRSGSGWRESTLPSGKVRWAAGCGTSVSVPTTSHRAA